jgi:hypothetical protein
MKFFYSDGNTSETASQWRWESSWAEKIYANPTPEKLVNKVEVWLRQRHPDPSLEAYERNTRVYRYASNTNVGYLTLNLPPYYQENNSTHFRVNVDATREAGDDVWFELVDGNASKTYANADFNKLLPIPAEVGHPKKLRIYLNQSPSSSTIGGTFVHAVYWGTDNPKSHWTGTQRVLRDNHYAEGLETLSKRSFSTPDKRFSTVGFRLVQRP